MAGGRRELLIEQIKAHIRKLKRIKKVGEPYNRLNGWQINKYLATMTIKELEFVDSELRMRRFAYNV